MQNTRSAAVLAAVVVAFATCIGAEARELVIYNASDSVNTPLVEAFKKKHPDINVKFVSGSTGPITERAIAEKAKPQADVVYLVNNIALEQLKQAGVFEPYMPKDSHIAEQFREPDGFYTKYFATTMCMVVNQKRLKQKSLAVPVAWEDLLKPAYRKEIAMPSPLKSGTGMAILTTFADAFGWTFIENLNENIYQYSDGGSGGATLAGNGEVAIGLTFDTTCHEIKTSGRPVEIVFGRITPNVTEGGGLVAGGPNPAEGKLFLDFMASEDAAKVLHKLVGATAVPGYGLVNLEQITLWQMRRPVDANGFKREFAAKFVKQ
ncbi:MAG: extracellular solute-binding protein [Alphaproteobacteria bacterium]|nr:extracellular solute-binding protein [Alphaproteobacteria bacterium]